METKLEQIAVKARRGAKFRFTSLAHHITRDRVLENSSASGSDPQPGWMVRRWRRRRRAEGWIEPVLQSIHRQDIVRLTFGGSISSSLAKTRKRPSFQPSPTGRPTHHGEVLSAIYEQDFVCSFGGRPKKSSRLGDPHEVIAGGMIGWVLEADLKNFLWSLNHDWVLRFVEHRARSAPDQLIRR